MKRDCPALPSPRRPWRSVLVVVACLVAGMPAGDAAASDGTLSEDLGRWLDGTAGDLGETLSRHPRFEGQTVRLVSLTPEGSDGPAGNRLADAVERRLRQRLLDVDGVRLAVDRPRRDCEPPQHIDYLIRVEVSGSGRDGRVHVAVVDVAESVWVSGISYRWNGRLSAAERRALRTPLQTGVPGSAGRPIPLRDADAIAAAIKSDLACTLPPDLSGGLFVTTPRPPALARVSLALQSALLFEPLAAVTPDRDQARWLLSLETAASDADVREVSLVLTDANQERRQQLASVFVSGRLDGAPVLAGDQPGTEPAPPQTPPPEIVPPPVGAPSIRSPGLLTSLEMRPARQQGICDSRRARMNSCVEISFEVLEPAYVFVMSTLDHRLVKAPCDGAPSRWEPGPRRYRLRVPPGGYAVDGRGPDAGFYVLAVRDRDLARRLAGTLATAPGACTGASGDWLGALDRIVADAGGRLDWRVLQLAHDSSGIVALRQ